MAVEGLQKDSGKDLDSHKAEVDLAIAAHAEKTGITAPGGGDDDFANHAIGGAVGIVGSVFVSILGSGAANNSSNDSHHGIGAQGHGVRGNDVVGTRSTRTARPEPTPLVPLTYGEKKMQAKRTVVAAGSKALRDGNLFTSVRLSGMSVAGRDSSGKKTPGGTALKGVKATPDIARGLGLPSDLVTRLDETLENMQGTKRYNDTRRTLDELRKGNDSAKQSVKQAPRFLGTAPSGAASTT